MNSLDKITLVDKDTGQRYEGIFSSQNDISISLRNVKGYKGIVVFYKEEFHIESTK